MPASRHSMPRTLPRLAASSQRRPTISTDLRPSLQRITLGTPAATASPARWWRSGTANTPTRRCPSRASDPGKSTSATCTTRTDFALATQGRSAIRFFWSGSRAPWRPTESSDTGVAELSSRPRSASGTSTLRLPAPWLSGQPGTSPDRSRERRHVVVRVAGRDQLRFEVRRQRRYGQVRAKLLGQLERDPQILVVELNLETERVGVGDHPADEM